MKKEQKVVKLLSPDILARLSKVNNKIDEANFSTKQIPQYIKELAEHFKKDKWPLSLSYIRSELFHKITGAEDLSFIAHELSKRGVKVGYGTKDGSSVLYVEPKKKPLLKKKKAKGKKK